MPREGILGLGILEKPLLKRSQEGTRHPRSPGIRYARNPDRGEEAVSAYESLIRQLHSFIWDNYLSIRRPLNFMKVVLTASELKPFIGRLRVSASQLRDIEDVIKRLAESTEDLIEFVERGP